MRLKKFIFLLIIFHLANTYIWAGCTTITYTVNSTNDVDDSSCDASHCSLREAINAANTDGVCSIITFSIGTSPIALTTALPSFTTAVTVDGTTNTGFVTNTVVPFATSTVTPLSFSNMVVLDNSTAAIQTGLILGSGSDGSIIRGLVLQNFGTTGASPGDIAITISSNSNTITACYIGVGSDGGTSSDKTEYGIYISGANNKIGNGTAAGVNLISGMRAGSLYGGIHLYGAGATGNTVKGNIIGLKKDGTTVTATMQGSGIVLLSNTSNNNTIGGTAAGEGNVISGNSDNGIYFWGSANGTAIYGNILGLSADGSTFVSSSDQDYGINAENSAGTIIGNNSGGRNIVAGNTTYGIFLNSTSSNCSIKGNYIGLGTDGTTFVSGSSQDYGIYFRGSSGHTIGGTGSGEGNLISGNSDGGTSGYGIFIRSGTNTQNIIGNIIGPTKTGSAVVTNATQQYGIYIQASARDNIIGGSTSGSRNIISANTQYGIYISAAGATGNSIKGNYIGIGSDGATNISSNSQDYGIYCLGNYNIIGGATTGEGNVISGNATGTSTGGYGIYMDAAIGNTIAGNTIGPRANGSTLVTSSTQKYGIYMLNASANNLIGGSTSTSRNIISANDSIGIYITGANSTANSIKGNYIGTASDGATYITSSAQNWGIFITSSANSNIIGGTAAEERNIISGQYAVNPDEAGGLYLGTNSNTVYNNHFGVNVTGTAKVSVNQNYGVFIAGSSNIIGGASSGMPNLSSGNSTAGVYLHGSWTEGGADNNIIKGNYIGLQSDGMSIVPAHSQDVGVHIAWNADNNIVGGTATGEGNLISDNGPGGVASGVHLLSALTNTVVGNIIGLQKDGSSFVSTNQVYGVRFGTDARNSVIGGPGSAYRNIISGNGTYGIYLPGSTNSGNSIKANYIGCTSAAGDVGGGDSQDYGIYCSTGTSNTIGSNTTTSHGNVIAYNTNTGVYVSAAAASNGKLNLIARNLIYSNPTKAININYGPSQGNNGNAKPTVTAFGPTSASGAATTGDVVEVFKNNTGNCQDAMTYLGSVTAAGGAWSLGSITINNGESVTATSTDANNNTSELSTTCLVGLPIELISFTAENINNEYTQLNWATASETNNDYFTIEKTRDGIHYEFVAKVNGAGNCAQTRRYISNDFNPYSGISYYRLKQTDFDGAYDYSDLVSVEFENSLGSEFKVFPNPTSNNNINISFYGQEKQEVLIVVTDVLGKEYYSKVFVLDNEHLIANIAEGFELAPGIYTITASSNNSLYNKKVIIK